MVPDRIHLAARHPPIFGSERGQYGVCASLGPRAHQEVFPYSLLLKHGVGGPVVDEYY